MSVLKKANLNDFKNALFMSASTGCNALVGIIGGLFLIKGLDQQEYGLVTSALAIFLVGQEFVGRGINDTLVRFGTAEAAGSPERMQNVFDAGLLIKGIMMLGGLFFFVLFPEIIGQLLGREELVKVLPAIWLALLGFALWSYLLTRYQARLDFGAFAIRQPVVNCLKVVLFIVLFGMGMLSWLSAVWITAICFLVCAVLLGTQEWKEVLKRGRSYRSIVSTLGEIWCYSGWNVIASIAFVAYTRMDIFILTRLMAPVDVAVYNAAWQMLTLVDLFTISIMTVMIPKASHLTQQKDLLGWCGRSLVLSIIGSILLLPYPMIADWFVGVMFGEGYRESIELLRIMFWGYMAALCVLPLIGILHAKKAFYINSIVQGTLLVVSVPAYYWGVGKYGTQGAAAVTCFLRIANCLLLALGVAGLLIRSTNEKSPVLETAPVNS